MNVNNLPLLLAKCCYWDVIKRGPSISGYYDMTEMARTEDEMTN